MGKIVISLKFPQQVSLLDFHSAYRTLSAIRKFQDMKGEISLDTLPEYQALEEFRNNRCENINNFKRK